MYVCMYVCTNMLCAMHYWRVFTEQFVGMIQIIISHHRSHNLLEYLAVDAADWPTFCYPDQYPNLPSIHHSLRTNENIAFL